VLDIYVFRNYRGKGKGERVGWQRGLTDLKFRVSGKQTRQLDGAEEIRVKNVLGPFTRLAELEQKGELGIVIVLLVRVSLLAVRHTALLLSKNIPSTYRIG